MSETSACWLCKLSLSWRAEVSSSKIKLLLSAFLPEDFANSPLSLKSLPTAIRLPSSSVTAASKVFEPVPAVPVPDALPVAKVASTLQYSAVTNCIRSRSLSTTMRTATLCTRPAESLGLIFFQSTGETSNP